MSRLLWIACACLAMMIISLTVGFRQIAPAVYFDVLNTYDPTDPAHVTLASIRLPRLAAGLIAGAALGVAGTVMQAITRNPLADPGILGVNAGAAFFLLLGTTILGRADEAIVATLAFPGAALASAAVFALGGGLRGDVGPVRLTLAGAALNALLLSLVTGIVLVRQDSLDVFRFWVAGSLTQATTRPLLEMAMVACAGGLLALAVAPQIEALSHGKEMSRGLGTRPGRVQAAALLIVTMTTGAAVAVAGPLAFLGLMVPPLARLLVGHRMRAELVAAALLGATILLGADTLGRLLLAPSEIRAGVMTALLGGPVFLWLARRIRPGATT
ncbi:FecCD family ABC transporter permease [Algicella marina]|uniref:Iron chelate uptake ABC transporter family permease subunit n=1 Tax=Algicella marina TaxID=2683284 RepID=A0A6P1SXF6_9RHOB|nr:iron ABC transporter permease [Algicella marina]QHQ35138.1 iron chelate uptake ABC transporter family permease subunit [Algicella marina]